MTLFVLHLLSLILIYIFIIHSLSLDRCVSLLLTLCDCRYFLELFHFSLSFIDSFYLFIYLKVDAVPVSHTSPRSNKKTRKPSKSPISSSIDMLQLENSRLSELNVSLQKENQVLRQFSESVEKGTGRCTTWFTAADEYSSFTSPHHRCTI